MNIYTAQDANHQTYTIQPGAPFTTYWLSGEASEINHPWNALDAYTAADLERYGITVGAPTLAQAQAAQVAALQTQYDTRRQSPMTWNFGTIDAQDGTGADKGAAGTQQLDVTDASAKNWLTAQAEAAAFIQAGQGTTLCPLLTLAGLWVQTTATQAQQVLLTGDGTQTSMKARERAMMKQFTALQVQINAATTSAACLAIDVTAGWPA